MDIKEYIGSGIIELYVMGLCSREEEQELEQLRSQYPELKAAILQYESEMESRMLQNSTLPPAQVDVTILEKLESLNSLDVKMSFAPVKKINPVPLRWLKPLAAASIVLLALSTFFNYTLYQKNKKQEKLIATSTSSALPAGDYAVITNPSITPVAMYGVGIHTICRCTMFWDKKTGKAYIMIHHLPPSSAATDYQLWAQVEGKLINIGTINDSIRGRFIEVSNVPARAVAFKVSLEKTGSAETPTDVYLEGRI
jgi:anti-sigma-K factor RskA